MEKSYWEKSTGKLLKIYEKIFPCIAMYSYVDTNTKMPIFFLFFFVFYNTLIAHDTVYSCSGLLNHLDVYAHQK